MQKHLIPTSVLFMGVSLASVLVTESLSSVASFVASSLVFAFLCWMDRARFDDKAEILQAIAEQKVRTGKVEQAVSGLVAELRMR